MTENSTVRSVTYDLGNRDATTFPKPWVKWSYEPARAQDVPEAFMRAYAVAVQPPAGPVYLSVPLDDWKQPLAGPARVRRVSARVAPDAERLRLFAKRISASHRPALVFGPEVDRAGGWGGAIALAERLRAAVYGAPLGDRASFPEDHPLFRGPLGISDQLAGHDLAVMIDAEVFRYYPYVPGEHLPEAQNCCRSPPTPGPPRPRGWATACSATPRSRSTCSWSRSRRAPAGRPLSRWRGHACSPRWLAAR
jgi:benzoylformate decarboxylase